MLKYRADVDILRALAILGVLFFHLRFELFSGGFVGVDVFFVISGFLISGILYDEFNREGKVDFSKFWARRFKRLMPMAFLVNVVVLIAAFGFGKESTKTDTINDSFYALIYATNWQKMFSAVDYFNESATISPYLHYWSLAVEEQFYVVVFIAYLLFSFYYGRFKKFRILSSTNFALLILISILSLSFILNFYLTHIAQPYGFFTTFGRIWQFIVGVLVMCYLRRRTTIRTPWIGYTLWLFGLLIIIATMFGYQNGDNYPGSYALIPTFGTGLAILGGGILFQNNNFSVLNRKVIFPIVYIGKISYSLYLWHWPVIILFIFVVPEYSLEYKIASLILSFILSVISYHYFESPLRFSNALNNNQIIVYGLVVSFIVAALLYISVEYKKNTDVVTLPGGKEILIREIDKRLPVTYLENCHASQTDRWPNTKDCSYGDEGGSKKAFLIGDSHAAHWFPAINKVAKLAGIKLYNRTKSACAPIEIRTFNKKLGRIYDECEQWRAIVYQEIADAKPDYIILSALSSYSPLDSQNVELIGKQREKALVKQTIASLKSLQSYTSQIIVIEDTPMYSQEPLACLQDTDYSDSCYERREDAIGFQFPWVEPTVLTNLEIKFASFNDLFCSSTTCRQFNNEYIMFRDRHHISTAYSELLSDEVGKRIFFTKPHF